ncbi:hypothetical protein [Dyadobacter sandarakinus]|uniref:Uncharacterized protein n=1 Tax=Dyadobacter sandarakinus TaxID=2747268 RepID=A0ABX7I0Y8_9BACT|nr:hypothetical protein [Dyadobacter sandarakinus]QRQ99409.1 hypothetical protein HWI92_00025 [Dyadobacter sandarakinus]
MNIKQLRFLSVGYLLLPNILFYCYWTNPVLAIFGLAVLLLSSTELLRSGDFSTDNLLSGRDLLIIGAMSLVVTFMCGVCGLAYQTFDYWCHNVKFFELYKYSWPIRIPADGPVISYYYGYYLVPALISKWVGALSEAAIFIWTMAGFYLGIAWVYIALNKKPLYVVLAMSVGDMPHVLKTVFYKLTGALYEFGDFGIESWSSLENLLWVPNQVIPSLLLGGMFIYLLQHRKPLEYIVLPVALTFWWAVFPAFTMGLLSAVLIIRKWILARLRLNWPLVFRTVALPVLACGPILLFFTSHEQAPVSGFIWQFPDSMVNRVIEYAINIGLNLAVFFLVYRFFSKTGNRILPSFPFWLLLIFVMVFPIYRIGKVNDFLFRGLIPYLLIIGIYLFKPLSDIPTLVLWTKLRAMPVQLILVLMLVSGSLIGAGRLVRALRVNVWTAGAWPEKVQFTPIPYDAYPNIYEVLKAKWSQQEADQYLGKKDSFYELKMAPEKPVAN